MCALVVATWCRFSDAAGLRSEVRGQPSTAAEHLEELHSYLSDVAELAHSEYDLKTNELFRSEQNFSRFNFTAERFIALNKMHSEKVDENKYEKAINFTGTRIALMNARRSAGQQELNALIATANKTKREIMQKHYECAETQASISAPMSSITSVMAESKIAARGELLTEPDPKTLLKAVEEMKPVRSDISLILDIAEDMMDENEKICQVRLTDLTNNLHKMEADKLQVQLRLDDIATQLVKLKSQHEALGRQKNHSIWLQNIYSSSIHHWEEKRAAYESEFLAKKNVLEKEIADSKRLLTAGHELTQLTEKNSPEIYKQWEKAQEFMQLIRTGKRT